MASVCLVCSASCSSGCRGALESLSLSLCLRSGDRQVLVFRVGAKSNLTGSDRWSGVDLALDHRRSTPLHPDFALPTPPCTCCRPCLTPSSPPAQSCDRSSSTFVGGSKSRSSGSLRNRGSATPQFAPPRWSVTTSAAAVRVCHRRSRPPRCSSTAVTRCRPPADDVRERCCTGHQVPAARLGRHLWSRRARLQPLDLHFPVGRQVENQRSHRVHGSAGPQVAPPRRSVTTRAAAVRVRHGPRGRPTSCARSSATGLAPQTLPGTVTPRGPVSAHSTGPTPSTSLRTLATAGFPLPR